jgi:catechol 2,3-dioxygenase-like lactoylglutathione lyase family enzyme
LAPTAELDLDAIERERDRIRSAYLRAERAPSSAQGLHHCALLCADVERTVRFYQEVLEFSLTETLENGDYKGSEHFFFFDIDIDIGNGNLLALFRCAGLGRRADAEVLGGLHHMAISVEPEKREKLKGTLNAAGIEYLEESGTSIYFREPRRRPAWADLRPAGRVVRPHRVVASLQRRGLPLG